MDDVALRWQYGIFLGVWALTAFAFVAQRGFRIQAPSARAAKQGASPLLGYLPMEYAYWLLNPLAKAAAQAELSPNWFSWACFGLALASGITAGSGLFFWAGLISGFSSLADTLDGMVARRRGVASDAGEVLDAAVDRYAEVFLLGGCLIYLRFSPSSMVLGLAALSGAFMVSYTQAKAEALALPIPKGMMRRPERALYLGLGCILSPLWMEDLYPIPLLLSLGLIGTLAHVAAAQRLLVMYRAAKSLPQP